MKEEQISGHEVKMLLAEGSDHGCSPTGHWARQVERFQKNIIIFFKLKKI